jgi:hypothetical protein
MDEHATLHALQVTTPGVAAVPGGYPQSPAFFRDWLSVPRRGYTLVVGGRPEDRSRFALDLARRAWRGRPWPDASPAAHFRETPTVWLSGRADFGQLGATARDFGLPGRALVLPGSPDELRAAALAPIRGGPHDHTGVAPSPAASLDEEAALERLGAVVRAANPALVVVEEPGLLTARNLYQEAAAVDFFARLDRLVRDLARPMLLTCAEGAPFFGRFLQRAGTVLRLSRLLPDQPGLDDLRGLDRLQPDGAEGELGDGNLPARAAMVWRGQRLLYRELPGGNKYRAAAR